MLALFGLRAATGTVACTYLLTASTNFVMLLYSENKTIALQALQRCLNLLHPCSPPPPLLQGYKAQLTQMGQWQAAMASLNPAVQQKLAAMCQL